MFRRHPTRSLILALACATGALYADGLNAQEVRAVRAERLDGAPVQLDGRLEEAAWSRAAAGTDFTQFQPNPGAAASQRTEARVLYDDEALYVGMRLHDTEASRIASQLGRRDALDLYSDWALVLIDSYHDRRTGFEFAVTPRGVQRDVLHYDDQNMDLNWDGVWEVATSVDDEGWTAEFRIPLSQLRFSPAEDGTVWGVNFGRQLARQDEWAWWSPILPDVAGFVSAAGELHGIRELEPPRRLEVLPYAVAQGIQAPVTVGDPFQREGGREGTLAFGGDVKYGLSSELTLSATINPDFGQVEADPSVFNLTAQEVFFAERRPFFTEGSNIFGFGIGAGGPAETLFYTRRIGRSPQRDLAGDYTDIPGNTTILGAAKVSGRTVGGWSVGFMDALTSEEAGLTLEGGAIESHTVEPLTNYGVARVMKDFREGDSRVGAILTTTHRRLDGDPGLLFLTEQAYSGGVDFRHRFAGDTWDFNGFVAASHVVGDTAAIQRLQESSRRYYQRPDADHLAYDPDATSLSGLSGQFWLGRVAGKLRGGVGSTVRTPGFEVNDAGFLNSADVGMVYGNLNFNQFEPTGPFRSFNLGFNPSASWDFGGDRLHTQANAWSNWTFLNNWHIGVWGSRGFEALSNGSLRGGPAIIRPGAWRFNPWANTDSRNPVWLNAWAFWEQEDEGAGWARNGGVNVNVRPSGALSLEFGPSINQRGSDWQYVDQVEDGAGDTRYLFAQLRQHTVSLTTRLSYTFAPTLSLQLYAQPFLTAGSYSGFREVSDPRAAAFADRFHTFSDAEIAFVPPAEEGEWGEYEVDRDGDGSADFTFGAPDFNFKELRSNVVLRWEYRPGSTAFLVWSQGRSDVGPDGAFRFGRDMDALLGARGSNVLALKVTYWFDF